MKKIITIIMIFLCLITTSFGALTDDLVAYYKFDGNTIDSTDNGNDGTNNGATSISSGKIGEAYYFDGVNDYIEISNSIVSSIITSDSFAISAWVNPEIYYKYIISMGSGGNYLGSAVGFDIRNDKKLRGFIGYSRTSPQAISSQDILLDTWSFVTMTYNGNDIKLYINGVYDGTIYAPNPTWGTSIPSYIGRWQNRYFNGKIDEIGIWQRALTESEVEELYNNGNGLQYPFHNIGNNLSIGDANEIIDEVFNNEFSNLNISNNQILYTSFQNDITTKRTYNRYIGIGNKRYAIYYGENPTNSIIKDNTFYTLEIGYTTENDLKNQLQNLIDNY